MCVLTFIIGIPFHPPSHLFLLERRRRLDPGRASCMSTTQATIHLPTNSLQVPSVDPPSHPITHTHSHSLTRNIDSISFLLARRLGGRRLDDPGGSTRVSCVTEGLFPGFMHACSFMYIYFFIAHHTYLTTQFFTGGKGCDHIG